MGPLRVVCLTKVAFKLIFFPPLFPSFSLDTPPPFSYTYRSQRGVFTNFI